MIYEKNQKKKILWHCPFKLLQNMVSNRTQHPPPPSQSHTVILYFDTGKGGGVEPERRLEGQQFSKLGQKYQHD